jgi:hypothetical protein
MGRLGCAPSPAAIRRGGVPVRAHARRRGKERARAEKNTRAVRARAVERACSVHWSPALRNCAVQAPRCGLNHCAKGGALSICVPKGHASADCACTVVATQPVSGCR